MPAPATAPDLHDMHAKFVSLFNAGDLDGLLELYEPDAVLNLATGTVRGKEAIRSVLQQFLSLGGKITIDTLAVLEGPDGIGLTHGDWKLQGGTVELGGKTAEVLRRQADGRWLYVIDNPSA